MLCEYHLILKTYFTIVRDCKKVIPFDAIKMKFDYMKFSFDSHKIKVREFWFTEHFLNIK